MDHRESKKALGALELSAAFCSLMDNLAGEWGFVLVRTAYAADETTDEEQWSSALAKIRAHALWPPGRGDAVALESNDFALAVMSNRSALAGASYGSVRTSFAAWAKEYARYRQRVSVDEERRESGVRMDCVLVVDEAALASLLQAPHAPQMPQRGVRGTEPFVVVVDAEDPACAPYCGGGPYMGWMRACVTSLYNLTEDLDAMDLAQEICPTRSYEGQIPLYDGSPRGGLVDPPGGPDGRYKFPMGTPRGSLSAQAMLDEIRRATGDTATDV
ncbi:hypothetical protein TruAng_006656 [Truncatella angustata]|nr:hypothetical protein TruAng_006656 [Truncatella angustata]